MTDTTELAEHIAEEAGRLEITIATAESLTSGQVGTALGAAPDASTWFVGTVVAYANHVKHQVLGVPDGPVVCAEAAVQMARGVRELLDADVAVSLTGVGGPGSEEGRPAGTVFISGVSDTAESTKEHRFAGEPEDVVEQSREAALRLLVDLLGDLEQQRGNGDTGQR